MRLIDELIDAIYDQMKMRFSDTQMRKLHCLKLSAIQQLQSEYFYVTSEQEMREVRICFKSVGKTPSVSPEDYMPIVNIITCGKICNVFKKQNQKFIIIQDAGSKMICRFDGIPDPEPVDPENDQSLEHVSENTKLLLKAIEDQKNELGKKATEVHLQNENMDILNQTVQVKGKLSFINHNKQIVILVNSCFIINQDEMAAFHNLSGIREKYDKD